MGLAIAGILIAIGIGVWSSAGHESQFAVELAKSKSVDRLPAPPPDLDRPIEIESEPIENIRTPVVGSTVKPAERSTDGSRSIRLVVRGSRGEPIPGAIAHTLGKPKATSRATSDAGEAVLSAPPPRLVDGIRVQKLGYGAVSVQGPIERANLDVTLERLPELNVIVERQDRRPPKGLSVQLFFAEAAPFVNEDGDGTHPVQLSLGAPKPSARATRPFGRDARIQMRIDYALDDEGRLSIPGLNPRQNVQLTVADRLGKSLVVRELTPSVFQARQPCVITIEQTPRTLEILVVDENRKPISGARIRAKSGERVGRTGLDGIARLTDLYSNPIDLRIDPLNAPAIPMTITLENDLERREVVVGPSRSIRVRVVDSVGAPVTAEQVAAFMKEGKVGKATRCEDEVCFRIDELPEASVHLIARVQGASFRKQHHTNDPVAVIVVPDHGSLRVELAEPLALSTELNVKLSPEPELDGSPPDRGDTTRRFDLATESPGFELVLPGRYTVEVSYWDESSTMPVLRSAVVQGVVVRAREATVVHCAPGEPR